MPTKTTTQRGLGWPHQQQRARLLREHRDGELCFWCGLPMFKSQKLEADHSKSRSQGGTKADRLLHGYNQVGRRCNQERGDGSKDHLRPALTGATEPAPEEPNEALGVRAMPWP